MSFGITGPCIIGCTLVIIACVVGIPVDKRETIRNIIIFLSGRFFAVYSILFIFWIGDYSERLAKMRLHEEYNADNIPNP